MITKKHNNIFRLAIPAFFRFTDVTELHGLNRRDELFEPDIPDSFGKILFEKPQNFTKNVLAH